MPSRDYYPNADFWYRAVVAGKSHANAVLARALDYRTIISIIFLPFLPSFFMQCSQLYHRRPWLGI